MLCYAKSLQACPTLCDPHRRQPTRLPRPWDSPGKNAGVGCHFLLHYMKVKRESEVAQSCPTLCDHMDTRLCRPWDFLGKRTGVGCPFLRHGIFPTQGSNPGLPHCRQTLYRQRHQGSRADWGGQGGWCNVGEGRIRSWEVGRPVSRDMGCHSNTSPCLASNQIWTVSVTSGKAGPINPANGLQPRPHRSSGMGYGEGWRCRVPTILGN